MKYVLLTIITIILTLNSFAEENTEHHDGPCIKIMDACKAAGYNKSSAIEKKSLSKNCIQPLLNGQSVEGVIVIKSDLDACKAKKSEVKSQK